MILVLSACTNCDSSLSRVVEEVLVNVVEIKCSEEGKFDSVGTAFYSDNSTLVTNAHVVLYSDGGEIYTYSDITIYSFDSEIKVIVESYDAVKDIAILKLINCNVNKSIKLSTEPLKYAETAFTIGNLNGFGLACNQGIVSAPKKIIKKNGIEQAYIQTDIEISDGNSGGPLYNSKGEIIGMITFKLRDANGEYIDGASFAIPITVIQEYMYNEAIT